MKKLNVAMKSCWKLVFFVLTLVVYNFSTSAMQYRETWLDHKEALFSSTMFSFHQHAAESVVKAQRFCTDKSSNIAAFAICLHNTDGSVVASTKLPYVVSSGDQKATSSGISTVLVKEMFLKSYDGLPPLDAEIQFIKFVRETNEYSELEELELALRARKERMLGILVTPDLTFSSSKEDQPKDKLLGSILHCEQAIIAKSILSKQFLANWIGKNFETCTFEKGAFLSFDIITYNDMCPKCFSTCLKTRDVLEKSVNTILKEMYPLKLTALPLRIFISSSRPYAVDAEPHTRTCRTCTGQRVCQDYMIFHNHIPYAGYKADLSVPVLQFFNPWITSYVTSFEVVDFIEAILKNKIAIGDAVVSEDHKSMLKCVEFSKNPVCELGLSVAATNKIEQYKSQLANTLKMIDIAVSSLQ